MSPKKIVTTGQKFTDIDAFACTLAYAELLRLQGGEAEVVLPGPLNESITQTLRRLKFEYKTELTGDSDSYNYCLMDVSDPTHFAKFVTEENVYCVFDHHWRFEDYWQSKLHDNSHIEFIGACATLVWEEIKRAGLESKISKNIKLLLFAAIVSNTLDGNAQITTERDRAGLAELSDTIADVTEWKKNYFDEMASAIMKDPEGSMKNDTKVLDVNGEKYSIIQVELWDSRVFIESHLELIKSMVTAATGAYSFLTSPSISEGFNYLVAYDDVIKEKLQKVIGAKFDGNIGKTSKLWLRKEIIKALSY